MILVDTSVWVDHLRRGDTGLERLLTGGLAYAHPFVIGELACGNLHNRQEVLGLLGALPTVPVATHEEVLGFIDRRRLMARGVGLVDVHLLASVALAPPTRLWTRDRRLAELASELDVAHAG